MTWLALLASLIFPVAHAAPPPVVSPTCTPQLPGTLACFPRAVNPQPGDLIGGMQLSGPTKPNQSVGFTIQQLALAPLIPSLAAPPPIGSTTPNTGAFTTLSASGPATLSGTVAIGGALTLSSTTIFSTSTTGSGTQTFTNSPCSGLTTAKWVPIQITGQSGTFYVPACQ